MARDYEAVHRTTGGSIPRMNWHTAVLSLVSVVLLSACFLSAEPRIRSGVVLAEGPVSFCTEDPPCQTGFPEGDGYILYSGSDDEEDMRLRFELLSDTSAGRVYLGEAELRNEDGSAWAYVLARAAQSRREGYPGFDIVMPGCNEGGPGVQAAYGITRTDTYSCNVSNLEAFRRYLIDTYSARFADPEFWRPSSSG